MGELDLVTYCMVKNIIISVINGSLLTAVNCNACCDTPNVT